MTTIIRNIQNLRYYAHYYQIYPHNKNQKYLCIDGHLIAFVTRFSASKFSPRPVCFCEKSGQKWMLQGQFCEYLYTNDSAIHHKNRYSYNDHNTLNQSMSSVRVSDFPGTESTGIYQSLSVPDLGIKISTLVLVDLGLKPSECRSNWSSLHNFPT